ncbi:MAG: hypothetical protein EXQ47_04480 [Bryobacterales bacterium]|nr:hypothetical protein [Bryobacterales bacterium]
MRFRTLALGREGPDYFPLKSTAVQGRQYLADARIDGIEGVAAVRFELTDAAGRALQLLSMWKATDSSTDGEFLGLVTIPGQPFRMAAVGTDRRGAAFRVLSRDVIQPPVSGADEPGLVSPGFPAIGQEQIQKIVDGARQEMGTRAARAATEHPGGVISIGSSALSRIGYEPFVSPSGAPLGLRLRYSLRFDADSTVAAIPHVFPVYKPYEWRGLVTMKGLRGTISPAPELGAMSLNDVIVYGSRAQYRAGVTYTFSIDMVPDYVFQGTLSGRYCVHDQKFAANPNPWNALLASSETPPYSLSWNDAGSVATIPAFYPQSALRANFITAGATDCGPGANLRF